jgi:predicted TIM-barrel fold metal-dependent hydrolase
MPPPLACDAHCHIFGPGDKFPYAADRAYTPPDSGIDDFEVLQKRLGLSRAVFVQASCHGTDNAAMVDALVRGQGRYAGVAMIDESFTDADIAALHDAGVRGTRFNFVAHLGGAPELPVFWRLVNRVVPFRWHIVLHFDAKDLPAYVSLLDAMPTPYVIDHMARVDAAAGLDRSRSRAPVSEGRALGEDLRRRAAHRQWHTPYDDVVPSPGPSSHGARGAVTSPTGNVRHMPDDGDLVDLLAAYTREARQQILVANPARLYDFA